MPAKKSSAPAAKAPAKKAPAAKPAEPIEIPIPTAVISIAPPAPGDSDAPRNRPFTPET